MSAQAWTLFGVIVGAVLGGGAQLVAGWLGRKHEKREATRALRREVYGEWIRSINDLVLTLNMGFAAFQDLIEAVPDMGIWDRLKLQKGSSGEGLDPFVDSIRESSLRALGALASVQLVAPSDTYVVAVKAKERLDELVELPPAEAVRHDVRQRVLADFFGLRDQFVSLAKRGLDIGS